MAGVRIALVTPEVATGTAAKTIAQLVAAANHRVLVDKWHVSFQGITAADPPVFVRVLRQTTAGTGGTANNPVKLNSSDDETLQTTGQRGPAGAWGAEPTADAVLWSGEVHPQGGAREVSLPFGREWVVPGGGRLGIEVTASRNISCVAGFEGQE